MAVKFDELPKRVNNIVCIVATGYAWEACVFGNTDKDYWALNNMYEAQADIANAFDEWFQIHIPGSGEGHVDDLPMREFLKAWKKPCWVQQDWDDEMPVVNPHIYPINEVINTYCPVSRTGESYPYFTNTIDYMICLALLRGYPEIQLYGVEFVSQQDDEYYKMRQSVNYYLGQAKQLGVKVLIQDHSSLLKAGHWYGYETLKKDPIEKIMEQNLDRVRVEKEKVDKELAKLQRTQDTLNGGDQTLTQLLNIIKLRGKGCQI